MLTGALGLLLVAPAFAVDLAVDPARPLLVASAVTFALGVLPGLWPTGWNRSPGE
ncbi:hypothetical protein [Actinopolymorpha pittospori]|uniref:Uncharacterized protein n=1 Tax=Actinopolymorpha pittospori TaxID=648752 RepID=A0A927RGU4_9ACTN|nr:hypothetical protein [Actinopolymorpha pittospori]MBE1604546.1 hypothetical protein [Actinopolymorpha pittospori]